MRCFPRALLAQALHYLASQWPKLKRYVEDGRCSIDNDAQENAIRPFCFGRLNWLFADTVAGAPASANSLLQTCRVNGIDGFRYPRVVHNSGLDCKLFEQLCSRPKIESLEVHDEIYSSSASSIGSRVPELWASQHELKVMSTDGQVPARSRMVLGRKERHVAFGVLGKTREHQDSIELSPAGEFLIDTDLTHQS